MSQVQTKTPFHCMLLLFHRQAVRPWIDLRKHSTLPSISDLGRGQGGKWRDKKTPLTFGYTVSWMSNEPGNMCCKELFDLVLFWHKILCSFSECQKWNTSNRKNLTHHLWCQLPCSGKKTDGLEDTDIWRKGRPSFYHKLVERMTGRRPHVLVWNLTINTFSGLWPLKYEFGP